MDTEKFKCNMCPFMAHSYSVFIQHVVRNHSHDANFSVTCCIDSCGYSTKRWQTYKVHVSRCHRTHALDAATENVPMDVDCPSDDPVDTHVTTSTDTVAVSNAHFALSLETKYQVSRTAIDDIIHSTDELVKQHLLQYRNVVGERLEQHGIDKSLLQDINFSTHFDALNSSGKRDRFYETQMNLVKPVEVILGSRKVLKKGILTDNDLKGYCIPLHSSISSLLSMPDVWRFVVNGHVSRDQFMHDICDGAYVTSHPVFVKNPAALQIILNTDDLEIVNPLGSHVKKHKITVFYYTLANIPPQYRSQLQCIQLVAIAKTQHLRKHAAEGMLLQDFITSVNKLSSGGLRLCIGGRYHVIEGDLVCVAADTLAAHWLGKFKEGVGFATRPCRHCECKSRLSGNSMK